MLRITPHTRAHTRTHTHALPAPCTFLSRLALSCCIDPESDSPAAAVKTEAFGRVDSVHGPGGLVWVTWKGSSPGTGLSPPALGGHRPVELQVRVWLLGQGPKKADVGRVLGLRVFPLESVLEAPLWCC